MSAILYLVYPNHFCASILVECTSGTYHSPNTGLCTPCEKGLYQDSAGQDSCKPCAIGFTTEQEGSKLETDCYST